MSESFEPYIRYAREVSSYLARYREIAGRVKEIARRVYPQAEVYVFGSLPAGRATALSDIDLLIVADEQCEEQNLKIRVQVLRELGFGAPVELHFTTKRKLEAWYKRFIGEGGLEKV